ncbi:MAG TPA: PEGA domain-containing protein [Kofleriaceae bacterium]
MKLAVTFVLLFCALAHAEDPKRKVVVLEYRSGSSALPKIADRIVATLGKQTSLALLGPDQTRAVYGDHLEQAIVKCAGEADCIAKIGQKVGAAEVVLVGISELGDVILTMQRIDVAGRQIRARVADSLAINTTPDDDQIAYYLAKILPSGDFLRFGVIDIIASQAGALVTIGGEKRGNTPIKPLKLHAPATYTVRVEKDGYIPFTTKIALPADAELSVNANLARKGSSAWYTHWYVLAIGGVIVAGAAGGTIYYLTRPPAATSVPVMGSF